jgi:hypothetical protein
MNNLKLIQQQMKFFLSYLIPAVLCNSACSVQTNNLTFRDNLSLPCVIRLSGTPNNIDVPGGNSDDGTELFLFTSQG